MQLRVSANEAISASSLLSRRCCISLSRDGDDGGDGGCGGGGRDDGGSEMRECARSVSVKEKEGGKE